ncbi:hypothetical protein TSUD_398020 [Trifolium subterraneum]|uniref:Reverse transcriptase domain-containing protein n=1 Tax=Trifolium subterraneum TaxID=3900 RepID=A0A2Z6N7I8_TRISU|nr:hypothetical protein TSUD_398020 [Trifolium subterraneum]
MMFAQGFCLNREHVLWCHGRITKTGEVFYVANVYVPCDDGAKQVLWASLSTRIQSLDRQRVCVCEDFNAVKHVDERRSSRGRPSSLDHIPFNRFIEDYNLVDLPLSGPNEDDWGPRPLRMLKCWRDIPGISWQQSRSKWLKEGDANSKYFHSVLAGRRRGNAITVIQAYGVTVEGVSPIRQAVFTHFTSHFKTIRMERPRVDNLQFKSYKSPGPDGINFGFIKDFWAVLRGDIMRFISEFHRNGKLTKCINSTFIALIPKIDNPQRLNDFRPISLVGSLYKILAKVLANRLRLVIGSVISETQTAFVKDRQILDGILIANEVVDEARKSKKELMLFKVDFEKAYDSVDWSYLDDAQFSDRWQWKPDPDKGYTVRGAYQLLTSQVTATMDEAEKLIWHSQVPLKVSIFAWRLLRDRLPTKANLISGSSLLHGWLWRDRVSSSLIYLMQYFWFSLDSGALVDWYQIGRFHFCS